MALQVFCYVHRGVAAEAGRTERLFDVTSKFALGQFTAKFTNDKPFGGRRHQIVRSVILSFHQMDEAHMLAGVSRIVAYPTDHFRMFFPPVLHTADTTTQRGNPEQVTMPVGLDIIDSMTAKIIDEIDEKRSGRRFSEAI